jgi:hypothetical protein
MVPWPEETMLSCQDGRKIDTRQHKDHSGFLELKFPEIEAYSSGSGRRYIFKPGEPA